MTTQASYGSWWRATNSTSLRLEDAVTAALDLRDFTQDDIDAVVRLYRDAINDALPEPVMLCGNEFYGPYNDPRPDIEAIVKGIDFWAIVEDYLSSGKVPSQNL